MQVRLPIHPAALRAAGLQKQANFDISQIGPIWESLPGPVKAALLTGGVGALSGMFSENPVSSMIGRGLGGAALGGLGAAAWPYMRSALGNTMFNFPGKEIPAAPAVAPAGETLPPVQPLGHEPMTPPSPMGAGPMPSPASKQWSDQWAHTTGPMTPPPATAMMQPGEGYQDWQAASTLR